MATKKRTEAKRPKGRFPSYKPMILGFYQVGIEAARDEGVSWEKLIVLDWFMRWYESHINEGGKMITQRLASDSFGFEIEFALIRISKPLKDLGTALRIRTETVTERDDFREDRNDLKIMARHFQGLVKKGYLERKNLKSSRRDDADDPGPDQFGSNRSWFAPTRKTLDMRPEWNKKPMERLSRDWDFQRTMQKAGQAKHWRSQAGRSGLSK